MHYILGGGGGGGGGVALNFMKIMSMQKILNS